MSAPASTPAFGFNPLTIGSWRSKYVGVRFIGTPGSSSRHAVMYLSKAPVLCTYCGCPAYQCKGSCVL